MSSTPPYIPQNYQDNVGPAVAAKWLNGVDQTVFQGLGGYTTPGAIAAYLGVETPVNLPLAIGEGGTGVAASSAAQALAALGGQTYQGQTQAEVLAGVIPTNYQYVPGDLRRYGGTGGPATAGIPSTDDSAAFATAVSTGLVVWPQGWAFKVVTKGTAYVGPLVMVGYGSQSQVYCDGQLLTVSNGTGSLVSNFWLGPITTPLVFQRNVVNTVSTTATLCVGPVTFTASVAGATSGTLTSAITNGTYAMKFSDGEIRGVTVTGGTAAAWTGALSSTNGSITTAGSLTINVASATGLAVGMQVFGQGMWNGATVTNIAGSTIQLSDPCSYSGTNLPVQFYSITFNTGSAAIATLSSTTAYGFRPPTINDTDVYSTLTSAQITQSQIGPIISVTGNNVLIERIYGLFVQLSLVNCNYSQVRDCSFKAGLGSNGYGYGGIVVYNNGTTRNRGNMILRNQVREAGNEGIWLEGQSDCQVAHNWVYGCGDSGIEFYQDTANVAPLDTYFMGGTGVTSIGNQVIGNYQGGINYLSNQGSIAGFNTAMCSSTGDYVAWGALGGAAFTGDGWTVSNLICEHNAAAGLLAYCQRSTFSNIVCRENQTSNFGSSASAQFIGSGLVVSGLRAWQETTRSTQYTMAMITSGFLGQNNTLMNVDLRDSVTSAGACLQLGGNVERMNVRTNGAPYDQSMESKSYVQPTYGASITIDLALGTFFVIVANNSTAFTINAPLNATASQVFRIMIQNTSGGALGTVTFNSAYRLAGGTAPSPSNGDNITIEFAASQGGTVFWELNRAGGNVGN